MDKEDYCKLIAPYYNYLYDIKYMNKLEDISIDKLNDIKISNINYKFISYIMNLPIKKLVKIYVVIMSNTMVVLFHEYPDIISPYMRFFNKKTSVNYFIINYDTYMIIDHNNYYKINFFEPLKICTMKVSSKCKKYINDLINLIRKGIWKL